jgi:hypothetical protein
MMYFTLFFAVLACFAVQSRGVVLTGGAALIPVAEGVAYGGISTGVSGLCTVATTGAPLSASAVTTGLLGGGAAGAVGTGTAAVAGATAGSIGATTAGTVATFLSGPVGWVLMGTVVVGAAPLEPLDPSEVALDPADAVLFGSALCVAMSAYLCQARKMVPKRAFHMHVLALVVLLLIAP